MTGNPGELVPIPPAAARLAERFAAAGHQLYLVGGPVRDALWYCDLTTSPDGLPVSLRTRIVELCARRGPDDPVVRALADNGAERAGAVRRTESLLLSVHFRQNGEAEHGRPAG